MKFFSKLGMNEAEQDEFLAVAGEELLDRVIERCFENLKDEEQKEFQTILDTNDSQLDEIFQYLDNHLPHFYSLVGQEYHELQRDLETIDTVITNSK